MEIKEYKKITTDMRNKLRLALPEKACKKHPTKSFLTSINPMYVIERLNDVFGVGSWHVKNDVILSDINQGSIVVKVTLEIPEYNVYLEQFGGNDNGGKDKKGFDLGDCFKGACTDGLTKLASYLEIGISIYQNEGNISNLIVDENAEIEKKALEKAKVWNEFYEKMKETLSNKTFKSVSEYVEFIEITYLKKSPQLKDNQGFKSIFEAFMPKARVLENKASQVNKFDKCNTCSNETEFCICDIDKKAPALAKPSGSWAI